MTEWQDFCVAQMGIPRWELRAPRKLGVVIADGLTLPLPEDAAHLLEAMLRALQVPRSQVQVVTASQDLEAVQWIWVVGEEVCNATVQTVGLGALLENPALKRPVWQALQGLKSLLSAAYRGRAGVVA